MGAFKVGDYIVGLKGNDYVYTNYNALMQVEQISEVSDMMEVNILARKTYLYKVDEIYTVANDVDKFRIATNQDFVDFDYTFAHEIKRLKDKIKALESRIEDSEHDNLEQEKPKRWRADKTEKYWFIDLRGYPDWYCDVRDDSDDGNYEFGNYFRTEEEAEFEAERIKVYNELKLWARPFELDEENWEISYNARKEEFFPMYTCIFARGTLVFESSDRTLQAVEAVGEERVLKYYLGVE